MKRLILILACLLPLSGMATIYNAASASFTDVSNACSLTSPGDTVQIPPGTNVWTQTLTVTNGISIIGSGTNLTWLEDNEPLNSALFVFQPIVTNLTRLSNLSIINIAGSSFTSFGKVVWSAQAYPYQWCMDNIYFYELQGDNVFCYGHAFSVIDHCYFVLNGSAITLRDSGVGADDGFGDWSWANSVPFGTSNMTYIEDCYFTNIISGSSSSAVYDSLSGGRSVFRHNNVWNTFYSNHGTDTGGRYRGARAFEIYNNNFTDNQGFDWPFQFRSGTGVIFSNTVTGYPYFDSVENDRSGTSYCPFNGATGFNPWDTNSATVYSTNKYTGANGSGVFVTTGVTWTPNQWYGYTLYDTNSGQFALVITNTATTITLYSPAQQPTAQPVFTNNDTCKIYLVYSALDQIGNGSGDTLINPGVCEGGLPITNVQLNAGIWPREISEPVYAWTNTLGGTNAEMLSGYPNIVIGVNIINDTLKPGYAPYQYPHPLSVPNNTNQVLVSPGIYPLGNVGRISNVQ